MKEYRTGVFSAQKSYTNRSGATPGEVFRSCMVCCFIPLSLSGINRAYADKRVLYLVKLLKPALQTVALLVKAGFFLPCCRCLYTSPSVKLEILWKVKSHSGQHKIQAKVSSIAPTLAWMQLEYIPMCMCIPAQLHSLQNEKGLPWYRTFIYIYTHIYILYQYAYKHTHLPSKFKSHHCSGNRNCHAACGKGFGLQLMLIWHKSHLFVSWSLHAYDHINPRCNSTAF